MFGQNFTLFTFMGFRVRANVSWLFLAILVTWSLAGGFFPAIFPELNRATYWLLGLAGMIGLFFSLLFHEFFHSLVGRNYGLPIRGITLFLFGGVAEIEMEPPSPKVEFWMAIAGPAASVLLAGVFYLVAWGLQSAGVPDYIVAVPDYLGFINLLLAAFNMVPGFPLDGGRVLRAALWHWKGDLRLATRWASNLGQGFGLVLVGLGILEFAYGNLVGGLWWVLIGLFLRGAAGAAYQRLLQQEMLKGRRVRDVMTPEPKTVPAETTVEDFVEGYFYAYGYDLFPVTDGERLIGCITLREVKELPRERWPTTRLSEIVDGCSEANTVEAGQDAGEALQRMQRAGRSRLLVVERGRLVGVLTLRDLLRRLQLRMELEDAA